MSRRLLTYHYGDNLTILMGRAGSGKGRWKYVSFVAYNKLAKYLNDSVEKNDCVSLIAEPITVKKSQADGDDIFTQYLAVRELRNVTQFVKNYEKATIHDMSDAHLDEAEDELEETNSYANDEGANHEAQSQSNTTEPTIQKEHGKTSMFIQADQEFEMDDDTYELEPEI